MSCQKYKLFCIHQADNHTLTLLIDVPHSSSYCYASIAFVVIEWIFDSRELRTLWIIEGLVSGQQISMHLEKMYMRLQSDEIRKCTTPAAWWVKKEML